MTPVVSVRYGIGYFIKEGKRVGVQRNSTIPRGSMSRVVWIGGFILIIPKKKALGWYRQHFSVEDWQINASDSNVSNFDSISWAHIWI